MNIQFVRYFFQIIQVDSPSNTINVSFRIRIYYKLGQDLLQIRAAFSLQIRAKIITNHGIYCKLEQVYYKLGQVLQIEANYHKLGHNNDCFAEGKILLTSFAKLLNHNFSNLKLRFHDR